MNAVIAELSIQGARDGEAPFPITVRIGTPYLSDPDGEVWACPVAVTPLYGRLADQCGGDSFQALCLAIALAQELLHGFEEKGGVLTHPSGDRFELESFSFGFASRR